jgi:hypothetical protein
MIFTPAIEQTHTIDLLIKEGFLLRKNMNSEYYFRLQKAIDRVILFTDPISYKLNKIEKELGSNDLGILRRLYLKVKRNLLINQKFYWEISLSQLQYLNEIYMKKV